MLNWTEEDVEFVATNIVAPMIKEAINIFMKNDKFTHDHVHKIADILSDRINEESYNSQRDHAWWMNLMYQSLGVDKGWLTQTYKEYCAEFDKMNKHLLEEKTTHEQTTDEGDI